MILLELCSITFIILYIFINIYLSSITLLGDCDMLFLNKRERHEYMRLRITLTIFMLPILILHIRKRNYLRKKDL